MSSSFSLIDEKWIPVLYQDGTVDRVGILEALGYAHRIRQIAASNPMDRLAILRFMLAVLYWCKGNPDGRSVSSLPPEWFSKLNDNRDCFDLLGNGKRFYQYEGGGEKLSASYLVQEVPTGTNMWHFRHATDGKDGLCSACCAMGLLRLPLFATSGGRGKPPGVNSKPPIYLVPSGASLAEMLLLSWQTADSIGKPFWEERPNPLPSSVPLLTGLTWVPRRVWLDEPSDPKSACRSCGRLDQLVRMTVFAPIGSQKTSENEPARAWRDPHVILQSNGASLHAADALGRPDAAAGQWSRVASGVVEEQISGCRAWVVGFATVQNDKYLEAMERTIPVPRVADVQQSIDEIKQWQGEGSKLPLRLRPPSEGASRRKHAEIPPLVASIRPHVEDRVSANVGKLLEGEDRAWQQAAEQYAPMMKMIARSLSPGFTTAALQRRRDIADTLPRMPQKPRSDRKEEDK